MPGSPSDDAAARLEQIVDDDTPRQQCLEWLMSEMWQGREADTLLAELVGNGWLEDDVQPLIDQARKQTHGARSVLGGQERAARQSYSVVGGIVAEGGLGSVLSKLAEDTEEIRYRIRHGRCHQCGHDVSANIPRCPKCGSIVVRPKV